MLETGGGGRCQVPDSETLIDGTATQDRQHGSLSKNESCHELRSEAVVKEGFGPSSLFINAGSSATGRSIASRTTKSQCQRLLLPPVLQKYPLEAANLEHTQNAASP